MVSGVSNDGIVGKNELIAALGYWPEFCDAKVNELKFSAGCDLLTTASVLLHYIDADRGVEAKIKIVLENIVRMDFNELSTDNVVDRVDLISTSSGIEFIMEACAGLFGSCTCEKAEVQLISLRSYQT